MADLASRAFFSKKLESLKFLTPEQIKELEESIYQYVNDDTQKTDCSNLLERLYRQKARGIFNALQSSESLRKRVTEIKISLSSLVHFSPRELNPEVWSEYNVKEEKEVNQVIHGELKSITTLYTCVKCGCKKHEFVEKYSRSGDEGSVITFTCVNCNKVWKLYN